MNIISFAKAKSRILCEHRTEKEREILTSREGFRLIFPSQGEFFQLYAWRKMGMRQCDPFKRLHNCDSCRLNPYDPSILLDWRLVRQKRHGFQMGHMKKFKSPEKKQKQKTMWINLFWEN